MSSFGRLGQTAALSSRALVRRVQREAERKLRVPADYLGRLGDTSFTGFLKFLMFLPVSQHRRDARAELLSAARIVATQHEDCGPCVQIAVNVALSARIDPTVIRAVLDRNHGAMPPDVSLVVRFADGVLAKDGSEAAPRDEIVLRFGATVLSELSLAIATARVFPTLKRGLGYAQSCSLVKLDLEPRR